MIKKFYFLFLSLLLFSGFTFAGDSTFYGNGKTGFGGTLGQGSLHISFGSDSLHFTFYKGPGALNDAVVIYMAGPESEQNGFTSTANFTDDGDGLRRAISGFLGGAGRSVLTFAPGFKPELAIAFNSDFAGVFALKENAPHEYVMSAQIRPTGDKNASSYSFALSTNGDDELNTMIRSMKKTQQSGDTFAFLVTYISETGYRSNEFIGDVGPDNNPGYSDYVSTSYAIGVSPKHLEYSITYMGNDNMGFGGAVGKSAFTISIVNDSLFYILTKKAGELDDIVVMYAQGDVPSNPTGISSTEHFTDYSTPFARAISGYDGTHRSILTFAEKFHPDIAFVMDKTKASLYLLMENGNHIHAMDLTFKVKTKSNGDIDYIAGMKADNFGPIEEIEEQIEKLGMLVNYVREDGFRSNEFVGDPGPSDNPGWDNYESISYIGDKGPIPVTLVDFNGAQNAQSIDLIWKTAQESNIEEYQIERSGDGVAFSKIGNVKANNVESSQTYSFKDIHPLTGANFYKLGIVSKDGQKVYSKVISIKVNAVNDFKAYTVSSNRILKLEYQATGNENLIIELTNSMGQKIFQTQIKSNTGKLYSIDLNKKLPLGVYSVSVYEGTQKLSKMIMVK